ncbi:MAG TPA: hypothetical protein VM910_25940 [Bradyrhizobium sp.]|nr:hypothetical protein [Bradyrhizobium sp.]
MGRALTVAMILISGRAFALTDSAPIGSRQPVFGLAAKQPALRIYYGDGLQQF